MMTARERLIQRFLDNELSPEEQLLWIQAVRTDPEFQTTAEQSVRLVQTAACLPPIHAPIDMAARVLQAIPARRSMWSALIAPLIGPAVRWNLAQAVTMACLIAAVAWQGARMTAPRPAAVSAEPAEVLVRLVMVQPDAETVAVAGDFNGWLPDATPLRRTDGGYWSVMLPLKPGRYHYMFVVDGERWVTDPFATDVSHDDFGADNAVLDVL